MVPSPDINFSGQIKLPMKPPTQIGIDHEGNLIRSFPFNMKADSHTELSLLAKSTRRQSLSMLQRVTSSTHRMQIVYKVGNSVEEISPITSTTTATTVTTNQEDTSDPTTQNSDYSDDDTKNPSAVPDSVCEDACDSFVTTNQGDTLDPATQNSDYSNADTKSPRAVPDSVSENAQGNTPFPTNQKSHKSDDHMKCKSFVADSICEDEGDTVLTTNKVKTSDPTTQNSDYSDDDNIKSLSVVPDAVSQDAFDFESPNSPGFEVQLPHSFSTEYLADSSYTFASQGLI